MPPAQPRVGGCRYVKSADFFLTPYLEAMRAGLIVSPITDIGEASALGVLILATGSLVDQKIEKGFPPIGYLNASTENVGGLDVF